MPIDYRKLDETVGVEEEKNPLEGLFISEAEAAETEPSGEIDYSKLDENLGLKGPPGKGFSLKDFLNSLVRKPGVDYSPEAQGARKAKSKEIVGTAGLSSPPQAETHCAMSAYWPASGSRRPWWSTTSPRQLWTGGSA